MTKKILVTGVAGFIGSNLAERLVAAGHDVVGIDNLSQGLEAHVPAPVQFHRADIRSREIYPLFANVDAVFQLAAKNSLPDCQRDPVETMSINVAGTANVFEACRVNNVPKILYAESSTVEEGDKRLKGFYAISKFADGMLAEGYRDAFNMNLIGLRYFNVYGRHQDYRRTPPPIMSRFIASLLQGEAPTLFEDDDRNTRDFIYVDDINDFHLLALEDHRADNRTFRLGSGKSYSIKDVLDVCRRATGSSIKPSIKPRPDSPYFKSAETLADISDAIALGWQPKTSLEEGIRRQVEYLQAELPK